MGDKFIQLIHQYSISATPCFLKVINNLIPQSYISFLVRTYKMMMNRYSILVAMCFLLASVCEASSRPSEKTRGRYTNVKGAFRQVKGKKEKGVFYRNTRELTIAESKGLGAFQRKRYEATRPDKPRSLESFGPNGRPSHR